LRRPRRMVNSLLIRSSRIGGGAGRRTSTVGRPARRRPAEARLDKPATGVSGVRASGAPPRQRRSRSAHRGRRPGRAVLRVLGGEQDERGRLQVGGSSPRDAVSRTHTASTSPPRSGPPGPRPWARPPRWRAWRSRCVRLGLRSDRRVQHVAGEHVAERDEVRRAGEVDGRQPAHRAANERSHLVNGHRAIMTRPAYRPKSPVRALFDKEVMT